MPSIMPSQAACGQEFREDIHLALRRKFRQNRGFGAGAQADARQRAKP